MQFKEYQELASKTAIYPTIGHKVIYPALGLSNESGEVLGKIKKIFRDKNGEFSSEDVENISKELGDVLWYISQIATELNIDLDVIAENNIDKLFKRKDKGTLQGNGDDR